MTIDLRLWRHLDANRLGPLQAGGYFCWPVDSVAGRILVFPREESQIGVSQNGVRHTQIL